MLYAKEDYIVFNSIASLAKADHEVLVLLLVSNAEDAWRIAM